MSVYSRLKDIRKTLGYTQTKMSGLLQIAQSNLGRFENGESKLTAEKMELLYQNNINIHWLLTGEGEMFRDSENHSIEKNELSIQDDITRIKLIDIKASAGAGVLNYEETSQWITVPLYLICPYDPNKIDLLYVEGDSMEPLMTTGDLLVVDPSQTEFFSERIFLIRIGEELRVKRLQRKANGNIVIYSENNQRYQPEEITCEEFSNNVTIIARVVKVIHADSL